MMPEIYQIVGGGIVALIALTAWLVIALGHPDL
jgi:hypothetical protein